MIKILTNSNRNNYIIGFFGYFYRNRRILNRFSPKIGENFSHTFSWNWRKLLSKKRGGAPHTSPRSRRHCKHHSCESVSHSDRIFNDHSLFTWSSDEKVCFKRQSIKDRLSCIHTCSYNVVYKNICIFSHTTILYMWPSKYCIRYDTHIYMLGKSDLYMDTHHLAHDYIRYFL
jgi:hypothetical protein